MEDIYLCIITNIATNFIAFLSGGTWMQAKETKFGKKANYKCENCEATGCQSKFCKVMRNRAE